MKELTYVILLAMALHNVHSMSEKQMKSAGKLIRNSCQPKSKVSDEQIDNMHKGLWEDDKPAKCYMNCVLSMLKVAKKTGEFDLESALAQIPSLPERLQAPTELVMKSCVEKVVIGADKCESSWNIAKCVYFENPENYFLP